VFVNVASISYFIRDKPCILIQQKLTRAITKPICNIRVLFYM